MKSISTRNVKWLLLIVAATVFATGSTHSQPSENYFIKGIVRDGKTNRPLQNVAVTIVGTKTGTITNAEGGFNLKIPLGQDYGSLEFASLGYESFTFLLPGKDLPDLIIRLNESAIKFQDIIVNNKDARDIVKASLERIGDNYSSTTALLTSFYRETVRKRNTFIDISEAVSDIYRGPYILGIGNDRVALVKGRRLVSPHTKDTLAIKLQGGPTNYIMCDIVKNDDFILNKQTLDFYDFFVTSTVMVDDRIHYVIDFTPRVVIEEFVLYNGKLFIDREDYTISRAEFAMMMDDKNKVTRQILRRKPPSLRFSPEEVSFVTIYKKKEGKSYLYYICNTIKFRCDWKRRLFSTGYTVVSETVITGSKVTPQKNIPYRESFRPNQVLSDKLSDLFDTDFWTDYNIIEPTESLDAAVNRLRKSIR